MANSRADKPRVALFATCLVDAIRPAVAFAAAELIENSGYVVDVPKSQTCCGQPLLSNGDFQGARKIASKAIREFAQYDHVVLPSGSCAATIKVHFPSLFDQPEEKAAAERLAVRCHEATDFLLNEAECEIAANCDAHCTYHDSCSGLRELGVREQPRRLLEQVAGLTLTESRDATACCGFGGTFCVKYPEISSRICAEKSANVEASGAEILLGGDLGCLMKIAGTLKRRGSNIQVYHVLEMLAGRTHSPGIGHA